MSVIRVNKNKNFVVMSNIHLKNKEMSLKAKGLLCLMLSLPNSWDYSVAGLCAICKENSTAVKSTLKELQDFGYLVITKKMPNETNTGRIEYEYSIYEQPQEKQGIENLPLEIQDIENPRELNTNTLNINNEKLNNNIYNVEQSSTSHSNLEQLREVVSNKRKQKNDYSEQIKEVIDYLNEVLGTRYSPSSTTTVKDISYILKKGYTVEQCKQVIDRKKQEWLGTEMEQYLRPSTLFRFSKFENYVNQLGRKQFKDNKKSLYNNHPDTQMKYYGVRQKPEKEDEMSDVTI